MLLQLAIRQTLQRPGPGRPPGCLPRSAGLSGFQRVARCPASTRHNTSIRTGAAAAAAAALLNNGGCTEHILGVATRDIKQHNTQHNDHARVCRALKAARMLNICYTDQQNQQGLIKEGQVHGGISGLGPVPSVKPPPLPVCPCLNRHSL